MSLISRLEDIPLNGMDLENMSDSLGNIKSMSLLYSDLEGMDVSSLFKDVDNVYVLYNILNRDGQDPMGPMKPVIGHWVLLYKNSNGIGYFDPYGLSISQDLHVTGEPDYYKRLFSGKVDVNKHRHQQFRDHVNTCGRHCVSRALFWFMTNDEYNQVIKPMIMEGSVKNADVYVSILTAFLDASDKLLLKMRKN